MDKHTLASAAIAICTLVFHLGPANSAPPLPAGARLGETELVSKTGYRSRCCGGPTYYAPPAYNPYPTYPPAYYPGPAYGYYAPPVPYPPAPYGYGYYAPPAGYGGTIYVHRAPPFYPYSDYYAPSYRRGLYVGW
jgi:hypothetical protein